MFINKPKTGRGRALKTISYFYYGKDSAYDFDSPLFNIDSFVPVRISGMIPWEGESEMSKMTHAQIISRVWSIS